MHSAAPAVLLPFFIDEPFFNRLATADDECLLAENRAKGATFCPSLVMH
jgi:hypothetical protein